MLVRVILSELEVFPANSHQSNTGTIRNNKPSGCIYRKEFNDTQKL